MNLRTGLIVSLTGMSLIVPMAGAGQASISLVSVADPDASPEIVVTGTKASREAADNRVICKVQKRMNTRFVERNCQTHRQWEQLREEHIRAAHEMIDRPLISGQ